MLSSVRCCLSAALVIPSCLLANITKFSHISVIFGPWVSLRVWVKTWLQFELIINSKVLSAECLVVRRRIKHFNIQSDWQQFPRSLPKYVKKSLFWLTKHKSSSTYSSKSKFLRQTNYSDSYPIRQWSVRAKNVRLRSGGAWDLIYKSIRSESHIQS